MELKTAHGVCSDKDQYYFSSLKTINQEDFDIPFRKAQYASMKRLISCLVNEKFFKATLFYLNDKGKPLMVTLEPLGNGVTKDFVYYMNLLQTPYIDDELGLVTLLDPEECGPTILESSNGVLIQVLDPISVVRRVFQWNNFDSSKTEAFYDEIANSIQCQTHLYRFPPKDPTFQSTIIEWEQSLIEGHATHPMHRARYAKTPMAHLPPENNVFDVTINFVAVKRSSLIIRGPYEQTISQFLNKLSIKASKLPTDSNYVILPVHHLQLPNLFLHFREDITLLNFTARTKGQASLRTLNLDEFPKMSLKLPLGLVTTSSMRTITPMTAFIGPGLAPVLKAVIKDNTRLIVAKEICSVFSNHPSINIAKHMAVLFRESVESLSEGRDEIVIPCMALTELSMQGRPRVCEVFQLNDEVQKIKWFQSYAEVILEVLIPPLVQHAFAFESHAQNMLLRIDRNTKEINGFIARDFGGFKCHQDTLEKTTGLRMETLYKGVGAEAYSLDCVNEVAFHTLIQCHLHRFIRALELHYNDKGWNIVRKILARLSNILDKDAPNYGVLNEWLNNPQASLKCFIKMKLETLERDYLYEKVPNVLFKQDGPRAGP